MGSSSESLGNRASFASLNPSDIKIREPEKKKTGFGKLVAWALLILLCTFLALAILLFVFSKGAEYGQVTADRHLFGRTSGAANRLLGPNAVETADSVFAAWTAEVKKRHAVERKVKSISMSDSLIGSPSDHIFLGIYERDQLNRKSEAALHFYLALSNGHPDAYRLYNSLSIPAADHEALYQKFISLHEMNGGEGLLRLGQYYLGFDVFAVAKRMRAKLRFARPNDYVWARQSQASQLAYMHFHMASLCDVPNAYEWRQETARKYNITDDAERQLKVRANDILTELAKRYPSRGKGTAEDRYCDREHLDNKFDELTEYYTDLAAIRYEEDFDAWEGNHPCDQEGHRYTDDECDEFDYYYDEDNGRFVPIIQVPTFFELIQDVLGEQNRSRRRGDGPPRRGRGEGRGRGRGGRYSPFGGGRDSASPVYRNNPGGSVEENTEFQDGQFEPDCGAQDDPRYAKCIEDWNASAADRRSNAAKCNDDANRQYNLGEADMAVGRIINARNRFERAIEIGRQCQSDYAILAGKRLAALNLTCEYTPRSLARISREYYDNPEGGAIIDLESRQRGLKAKGHYSGSIDGKYGQGTRDAVRKFQREFGFDETGDLTPIETVYLICSAAEVHSDLKSTNTLGIMYMAGLGVIQSTDRGIYWLTQAAERGNEDAMYNLALIYGTATVVSSYRLCGNVENIARADSWLEQSANYGHPPARRLVELYGALAPSARWVEIREQLQLNDFYKKRLEPVGEACTPNP
ncbi:MAG: peptidoglycan-binding protein [Pseudomonadota bacterium]